MAKFYWRAAGLRHDAVTQMRTAIALFEQSATPDPTQKSHLLYFDFANLCIESGIFDEALDLFKKAIQLKPQFIDAYLTLSQFLSTLNRD